MGYYDNVDMTPQDRWRASQPPVQTPRQVAAAQQSEIDKMMAKRPGYLKDTDASGNLKAQYKLTPSEQLIAQKIKAGTLDPRMIDPATIQKISLNTQGIDEIRNRALETGDSAWAKLMLQKQGVDEATARDEATQRARSGQATAESDLAMRGGLGTGARLSLAKAGMRNLNRERQVAARQGSADRLNIGLQDQTQKNDFLKMLPGADKMVFDAAATNRDFDTGLLKYNNDQRTGADKFNIEANLNSDKYNADARMNADKYNIDMNTNTNKFNIEQALNDRKNQSADNLAAWQEQMKAWAANKQADATEKSGK